MDSISITGDRHLAVYLKIVYDILHALVDKVYAVAAHAVVLVGVYGHVEWFIGCSEGFDHLVAVLYVNVIVAGAMCQQEFAFQAVGEVDGRVLVVTLGVVLRQTVV